MDFEKNSKTFKKAPFRVILGKFRPSTEKRKFSTKIRLCHSLRLMTILLHAKFQKKTNERFLRKMTGRTDRRTRVIS